MCEEITREVGVHVREGNKRNLGLCNACSVKYSGEYQKVYEVTIGQWTCRICPFCLTELKNRLHDAIRRKG